MRSDLRRWRWPIIFTLTWIIVVVLILSLEWSHRQNQNFTALMVSVLWSLIMIVWVTFRSPFPFRTRLAFVMGVALIVASVRVRGVTGDWILELGWRWGSDSDRSAETSVTGTPGPWAATSNDYPQFLGPDRNGILKGVDLDRDWESHPPEQVWRHPIGEGWSSFAVIGKRAVTQEQDGSLELVTCYDLLTGERLWAHADTARHATTLSGIGPRATPTVDGDRVFAMGATGILNCLDLGTGSVIWRRDTMVDHNARPPMWGTSDSPLVLEGRVIVAPGGRDNGSLAAYDRKTGDPLWSGGSKRAGYSSPQLTTLAGRSQILIFTSEGLAGHDPNTGAELWGHPWEGTDLNISQPVPVSDDRFFVSTGYGVGGRLFRLSDEGDSLRAEMEWWTPRLKAKFANVIPRDGVLYGLDDGVMTCINLSDGSRRWKAGRYGHGQMIMVDDLLLVTTEKGEVVLLEVNPDAHVELGRFKAVEGKTWNHAALASPYLLVRNAREAACYKLALKPPGLLAPVGARKGASLSIP